tara:strand:- start:371 stop:814 length:444 start_codon:yes stop_codon:yes gene_type:complete
MDIEKLREELKVDEGCKYEVYKDHLGYPTFGIGHLITDADPEYGLEVGTQVIDERVHEVFEKDIEIVIADCKNEYVFFDDLPEEAQHIVANMMFNMGKPRMSKFLKFKVALAEHNWENAAIEMEDSRWHKQVTNRANRLIERMKNVS